MIIKMTALSCTLFFVWTGLSLTAKLIFQNAAQFVKATAVLIVVIAIFYILRRYFFV